MIKNILFHSKRFRNFVNKCLPDRTKNYINFVYDRIELNNKCVLDIGCGNGLYSLTALNAGAKLVIGIEPELEGSTNKTFSKFKQIIRKNNLKNIYVFPTTFQEYNPKKQKFDIILLHNSINHLDEEACINIKKGDIYKRRYYKIFNKLYNLLNSKGRIIIIDCTNSNFWQFMRLKNPFCPTIEWKKHQAPVTWANLLEKSGFKDLKVNYSIFHIAPALKIFLDNAFISYFFDSHFKLVMSKNR